LKNKLTRFKDNEEAFNVIQPGKDLFETIKGQWHDSFFQNNNDIVLELACGRGEYTTGLGAIYPDKNFIGIDIKGARIWKGAKWARDNGHTHIAFLRTQIDHLDRFFDKDEVSEIWLTFPDPRPKKSDMHRRLTYPRYLGLYRSVLKPGGWFRFKTDNAGLFEYSLEEIQKLNWVTELEFTRDLYTSPLLEEHHGIKTRYELEFTAQGARVHYLKCRFY
jgi:tRNA (guanine-N7-)-methyltransferase